MRQARTSCGWAAGAVVLLAGAFSAAAQIETLTYTVSPQPGTGRVDVQLVWQTWERGESALCVARTFGTVADVAALIEGVRVTGAESVDREGHCWRLRHVPGAELTVTYAVDPGRTELDWESTHHPIAQTRLFHGIGSTFLLTPASGGGLPEAYEFLVRWRVPEEWSAACSWGVGKNIGARLRAEDVRNASYLAGRLVLATAAVPGARDVTVALAGEFAFDAEKLARVAAEILGGQVTFMHEMGFPEFVVLVVPVGPSVQSGAQRMSGNGLYHSFAMWLSPGAALNDGFEHLFAHEVFHFWNGRLLPAAQPDRLVYWFIEGFTDYYALRILYESGHWPAATYAKWINRHLREYDANPAKSAKNEQIVREYWTARDTVGEVSYQRGLLLGLRWHKLAKANGVSVGLDALFKQLVARGRAGGFELTNDAVREVGVQYLGAWFAEEFDRHVVHAEPVDVPRDALEPGLRGRVRPVYAFELGFDREASLSAQRVTGLDGGSSAAKAGLREGDDLVGWEVHGDPDERIRLQVLREGKVKTIRYYPRGARRDVLQFAPGMEETGR